MAYVLSSVSGNLISAASAGFAPTNSADVSAIASAYQVVSATATQLYAGTAYVTSVNDAPISAARAGNAANASMANSAYYDGTGRLISALPDEAAVSAIASAYAESAASSKQDTLTFGYNTADQISSIDGSALGGMDEAAVSAIASAYAAPKLDTSALERWQTGDEPLAAYSGIGGYPIHPTGADYAHEADYAESADSATYAESADYWTGASGKQDTLTFGYDTSDKISSINGSSLAGEGGGLVTAIGTGQDPWYQTSISSINGMNLSAQWADSADHAHAADIATSATYAQTADFATTVAPWVVSAYISAVTSRSGTIIVTNRTGIDATDSAVVGEYVPGYSGVSTYGGNLVPFNGIGSAIFTGIPDSLPVTASLAMMYGAPDTVTFSGSNGTTASASYAGSPTALTADLGKVSSVYVYTQNQYIQQYGLTYTADAIDNASIVALAHASALPTYQYDAEDKISSINGSAIAGGGGGGGLVTAIGTSESGITSINNSGLVDTAALRSADYSSLYVQEPLYISASGDSSYIGISALSSYVPYSSLEYNTASAISGINGSALAAGSTYSAGEGIDITDDVISVEAPVDIVAGPGIVIDNPDGNTLRVSMAQNYETLLWSGDVFSGNISLSEPRNNFSRLCFVTQDTTGYNQINYCDASSEYVSNNIVTHYPGSANSLILKFSQMSATDPSSYNIFNYGRTVFTFGQVVDVTTSNNAPHYKRIYGINRTASAQ